MKLQNLRIGVRLGSGFGLLACLLMLTVAAAVLGIDAQFRGTKEVIDHDLALAGKATAIREQVLNLRRFEKDTFINIVEKDKVKEYRARWDKRLATLRQTIDEGVALAETPEQRELLQAIGSSLSLYVKGYQQVYDAIVAGDVTTTAAANADLNRHKDAVHRLESISGDLTIDAERRAQSALLELAERKNRLLGLFLVMGASALGVALFTSWLLSRSITRPLANALQIAETTAKGDLTLAIESTASDEIGQLLAAMKAMQDRLSNVVGQIRESTDAVGTASREIAQGNADLSQRTEEQASSLEETASSMEELTSTVKQNADNARQANQLAASASEVAAKGGAVVGEVVSTMDAMIWYPKNGRHEAW